MEAFAKILVERWEPSDGLRLHGLDPENRKGWRYIIHGEFEKLLKRMHLLYFTEPAAPEFPEYTAEMPIGENTTAWHFDSHDGWKPPAIAVWSSRLNTEMRDSESHQPLYFEKTEPALILGDKAVTYSTPEPLGDGSVILINNERVEHRQPRAPRAGMDRWFCRAWILNV